MKTLLKKTDVWIDMHKIRINRKYDVSIRACLSGPGILLNVVMHFHIEKTMKIHRGVGHINQKAKS